MAADKEIETMDALRRTRLANERTYLAWWRSALTALAVAVGTGRIAPGLAGGAEWPYRALGAAFAVLAAVLAGCAYVRQRNVERAIATERLRATRRAGRTGACGRHGRAGGRDDRASCSRAAEPFRQSGRSRRRRCRRRARRPPGRCRRPLRDDARGRPARRAGRSPRGRSRDRRPAPRTRARRAPPRRRP